MAIIDDTLDRTIEKLKKQLSQAEEHKKKRAAQKAFSVQKRERDRETRRKILVGSMFLQQAQSDEQNALLLAQLDGYLKKNGDRGLFDLPPLPKPADAPPLQQAASA